MEKQNIPSEARSKVNQRFRNYSTDIDEIKRKGADGMDIDMEYIPAAYKDGFSAFVQNAADRLHAEGLVLNIDLAPKTSADQQGTLYEAHNYASLGASADLAFLMTYEWGYQFHHTRYM